MKTRKIFLKGFLTLLITFTIVSFAQTDAFAAYVKNIYDANKHIIATETYKSTTDLTLINRTNFIYIGNKKLTDSYLEYDQSGVLKRTTQYHYTENGFNDSLLQTSYDPASGRKTQEYSREFTSINGKSKEVKKTTTNYLSSGDIKDISTQITTYNSTGSRVLSVESRYVNYADQTKSGITKTIYNELNNNFEVLKYDGNGRQTGDTSYIYIAGKKLVDRDAYKYDGNGNAGTILQNHYDNAGNSTGYEIFNLAGYSAADSEGPSQPIYLLFEKQRIVKGDDGSSKVTELVYAPVQVGPDWVARLTRSDVTSYSASGAKVRWVMNIYDANTQERTQYQVTDYTTIGGKQLTKTQDTINYKNGAIASRDYWVYGYYDNGTIKSKDHYSAYLDIGGNRTGDLEIFRYDESGKLIPMGWMQSHPAMGNDMWNMLWTDVAENAAANLNNQDLAGMKTVEAEMEKNKSGIPQGVSVVSETIKKEAQTKNSP